MGTKIDVYMGSDSTLYFDPGFPRFRIPIVSGSNRKTRKKYIILIRSLFLGYKRPGKGLIRFCIEKDLYRVTLMREDEPMKNLVYSGTFVWNEKIDHSLKIKSFEDYRLQWIFTTHQNLDFKI